MINVKKCYISSWFIQLDIFYFYKESVFSCSENKEKNQMKNQRKKVDYEPFLENTKSLGHNLFDVSNLLRYELFNVFYKNGKIKWRSASAIFSPREIKFAANNNDASPVNIELVEGRRSVALMVSLQHGSRHGVPGDDLLVEHHRALEGLAHVDVLERDWNETAMN